MKLSAAERQRQYRARRDADPVRRAENLQKDRNRWHKKKNAGQTSGVADLDEREKRYKRRYWREAQQRCRARRQQFVEMTPLQMPERLPRVPSTVRLHQMITFTPGKIIYRDIYCLCSVKQILEYGCRHNTHMFEFEVEPMLSATAESDTQPILSDITTDQQEQTAEEINWGSKDVIGRWCVVKYDDDIYPGTIVKVNETHAKVTCMHKVGANRFYWPVREDTLWYLFDDILRFIPQPTRVTSRHVEINKKLWAEMVSE